MIAWHCCPLWQIRFSSQPVVLKMSYIEHYHRATWTKHHYYVAFFYIFLSILPTSRIKATECFFFLEWRSLIFLKFNWLRYDFLFYKRHSHPIKLLLGSPMLMDPSQQTQDFSNISIFIKQVDTRFLISFPVWHPSCIPLIYLLPNCNDVFHKTNETKARGMAYLLKKSSGPPKESFKSLSWVLEIHLHFTPWAPT